MRRTYESKLGLVNSHLAANRQLGEKNGSDIPKAANRDLTPASREFGNAKAAIKFERFLRDPKCLNHVSDGPENRSPNCLNF